MGSESAQAYYGRSVALNSSDDISRFRAWIQLESVRGLVTARFLSGYSTRPHVDCWVVTDRLRESVLACLRLYEAQGGVVAMARFDSAWSEALRNASNASPHGDCAEYFDGALAAKVRGQLDAPLYRAFKWDGCCGRMPSASVVHLTS